MRTLLPEGATLLGYWVRKPDAAFLAVSPDRKRVLSVVALASGTRIHWNGQQPPATGTRISSLDLEGVLTEGWCILFHTEPVLARSVLSFDTGKRDEATLRFALTGLAAGNWEIWRNGWSVETGEVQPREGVLYFEGRPGSYFLRPLS